MNALISLAIEKTKGISRVVQVALEDVKTNTLNELRVVAAKSVNELEAGGGKAQLELGDTQKLINILSIEFKKEIENVLTTVEVEVRKTLKKSGVETRKDMVASVSQLSSVTGKIEKLLEDKKDEVDKWLEDKKGEVEKYLAIRECMADIAWKLKDIPPIISLTEDPLKILQMSHDFIKSLIKGLEIFVKEFLGKNMIEESWVLVKDRMFQTDKNTWSMENKQTFSFLAVTEWYFNELRRLL